MLISVFATGILFRRLSSVWYICVASSSFSCRATAGAEEESMKGHNGGVFEWTSTVLEKHDGFIPSCLHPRYSESADSFDREHQVVVGGSYASVPRLAERRTLRNLYHHNDPYAGVGARIAYDA